MSTKIAINSNKVTPFGGIFYVLNQFYRFIGRRVDTDGPGVTTIKGLPVHIENRDGNTNVRFMRKKTLKRMFSNLENNGLKVRRFRADCGSYTQKVVTCALEHAEFIYIRAERCASLYKKVKKTFRLGDSGNKQ